MPGPTKGSRGCPISSYEDADLYEDEQRLIFRGPVWNYLGLEIEIPTAGDYITSHVGDTPVIVLRRVDGGISAMVNRCAHKGSMICYQPAGHVSELTCPYHNWVYDLDGNLKSVAFRHGAADKAACRPISPCPRIRSYASRWRRSAA